MKKNWRYAKKYHCDKVIRKYGNWDHRKYNCVKRVRSRSYFGPNFSRIRTEHGEIRSISPYSVGMRENADQSNSEYGLFLRSVWQNFESFIPNFFSLFPPWKCWNFNAILLFQDGGGGDQNVKLGENGFCISK